MTLVVVLLALLCAYLVFSRSQVVPEPLEVNMEPQMWCEYGVKAGPFIIIKPMPQPTLFEVGWKYAESWFANKPDPVANKVDPIADKPSKSKWLMWLQQSTFALVLSLLTVLIHIAAQTFVHAISLWLRDVIIAFNNLMFGIMLQGVSAFYSLLY